MKKSILFFAVLFILVFAGCSPSAESSSVSYIDSNTDVPETQTETAETPMNCDFRNTAWGMSMNDVINIEGTPPDDSDDNAIVYLDREICDFSTSVYYLFNNDKLIGGMYSIQESHTNENAYIDDYNKLKEALISKYGEPDADNIDWKDDLYKDDPQDYGFAVSLGDLTYVSTWNLPDNLISLVLRGDNYKISLGILYQSDEAINSYNTNTEGL